jgi:hypothetical protein
VSAAAERARAVQNRDRPKPSVPTEVSRPVDQDKPSKPRMVRQTVDLTVDRHNSLAAWRTKARQELELVRLTNQDVLRELVGLVLTDETVARRLRARLIDVANDRRSD